MRRAAVICVPIVFNPFPEVSNHIMKTESVWGKCAYGRWLFIVPCTPRATAVGIISIERIAPRILRLASSTCCVLPFSFGEQSILLTRLFSEPCDILLGVEPADVGYGQQPPPPT